MSVSQEYDRLVARWRPLKQTEKFNLLNHFKVNFAYNSGKIENDAVTWHDTHEIFENGRVISYTGDLRTLFEIQNLKNAWEWLLRHSAQPARLGVEDVLDAHRVLTSGTYTDAMWARGERPGTFKRGDYRVGVHEVGASPKEVPALVAGLVEELAEHWEAAAPTPSRAITIAAYLHAALVSIHPFADGNGRTCRLLTNLALLWFDCPPVSVREQDRIAYYGALDAFHEDGELAALIDFLQAESLLAWGELTQNESSEKADPSDAGKEKVR